MTQVTGSYALPPSSNSSLAAYTKDPAWQLHAHYFDSIFAREENAQLSKVREFSKKYLTEAKWLPGGGLAQKVVDLSQCVRT